MSELPLGETPDEAALSLSVCLALSHNAIVTSVTSCEWVLYDFSNPKLYCHLCVTHCHCVYVLSPLCDSLSVCVRVELVNILHSPKNVPVCLSVLSVTMLC